MTAAVWSSSTARDGVQVVVGDVGEAGHHRLEARRDTWAGPWPSARRRSGRGSPSSIVTILYRPDGVAVGPGELDRRLVRLGAAVAEEALAAERPLRQRLGERPLRPPCTRCSARGSTGRPARGPPRPRAAGSGRAGCSPSRGRSRGSGVPRRPRSTNPRPGPGRPGSGGSWGSRTGRTGRSSPRNSDVATWAKAGAPVRAGRAGEDGQ